MMNFLDVMPLLWQHISTSSGQLASLGIEEKDDFYELCCVSRSWKIGFDAWWRVQTKIPDSKFVCYEEVMHPMITYHQLCRLHLMPHM